MTKSIYRCKGVTKSTVKVAIYAHFYRQHRIFIITILVVTLWYNSKAEFHTSSFHTFFSVSKLE